ncbi:MAG: hypothetical protein KatS3mg014_0477 [Actinomycetota bacterium]|nr:MAG: hypothetical protein KatS3mg014_0477 [Actinomycetota bacterium]
MLDDPFFALDPRRRRRLGERLAGRGQVFVSAADAAQLPEAADLLLSVRAGEVRVGVD